MNDVVALAAEQPVGFHAAGDRVGACAPVGRRAADERDAVGAVPGLVAVEAGPVEDDVVAPERAIDVVALAVADDVAVRAARDDVVALGADERAGLGATRLRAGAAGQGEDEEGDACSSHDGKPYAAAVKEL